MEKKSLVENFVMIPQKTVESDEIEDEYDVISPSNK